MSPQRRFVGVARPPQGIDATPPRAVLDLRSPPTEAIDRTITGAGPSASPGAVRPHHYVSMAQHRRRFKRLVYRRLEAAVWITTIAVVVAMVAAIAPRLPRPVPTQVGAFVLPASTPSPVAAPDCFLSACGRPELAGPPTFLRIPAINVSTALEDLVLDANKSLRPPRTYTKAGWWTQGVAPGDTGAAVIAGHVDSTKGPAVFYDLKSLRPGDTIEVDRGGQALTFHVYEVARYPKNAFPTDRVYQPTPDPELRLITCGGVFDEARLSYLDNVVVYAALT